MPDIPYSDKPLYVGIVWHQHQPFYKDLIDGDYLLPWVRLHAVKDYYDMAAVLEEFPSIHATFNLVPSLLIQLDDYAKGNAVDPFLRLTLKPASDLKKEERIQVLQDFFMANWKTMVEPYPRYNQLLIKRGRYSTKNELSRISTYFSNQDLLDLQVWFNLTWTDPFWRNNDSLIKNLFKKGKKFTEKDKIELIAKHREICGNIIPKHRILQEKGQIEISTSPFYHPIMPLICDTNIAHDSNPGLTLPRKRFNYPEDIENQIKKSIDCYVKYFGVSPKGIWPSEGAVSDAIMPILVRNGIKWTASDEKILFKSLPFNSSYDQLYQPYKIHNSEPPLFMLFRNQELSDAIGFHYAKWNNADAAAQDLIRKLHRIRESLSHSKEDHIVTIILDGENCWENYPNDGWDFLRSLYGNLSSDPLLKTVTISEYLNRYPAFGTLKHVWPGSWINANFDIWIGHREKNCSWHYLAEARTFLEKHLKNNPEKKDLPQTASAWEEMYIAEGSDWNWWYGDDNSSSNDREFDQLYRKHLMNIYTLMNERIPDWLYISIMGKNTDKISLLPPVDLISPKIDGKISNYYEWNSAGFYRSPSTGGAMWKSECIISSFHYGFDTDTLFFRIDTKIALDDPILKQLTFKVVFLAPDKKELIFRILPGGKLKEYGLFSSEPFAKIKDLPQFAAEKIIEFAVPFNDLKLDECFQIEFMMIAEKNFIEIERWPLNRSISLEKPTKNYKMINWSV